MRMSSLIRKQAVRLNESEMWRPGSIVWSIFTNQWWPSMIITVCNCAMNDRRSYVVFWFGDNLISKVYASNIIDFQKNYRTVYAFATLKKPWVDAVNETVFEYIGHKTIKKGELHKWAESNIASVPQYNTDIPSWIKNMILNSSDSFETLANMSTSEFMKSSTVQPVIHRRPVDEEPLVLSKSKDNGMHGYCLSCYSSNVDEEHPFFVGHLCSTCSEDLKSVVLYTKTPTSLKYCIVCADTVHDLKSCSNTKCSKSYCEKCLKNLPGSAFVENYINQGTFECLHCINEPNRNVSGFLMPRLDFQNRIEQQFVQSKYCLIERPVLGSLLKVLSIDDSQQRGMKTLTQMGIPFQTYFVVNSFDHIPKGPIIKDLGSWGDLTENVLVKLGRIDLVIMGSPSDCHPDNRRIGCFYEYFRVLNLLKKCCSEKFFWFFETTASIDINQKVMVDRFLQCKPVKMSCPEERLFWSNFPSLGKDSDFCNAHKDKGGSKGIGKLGNSSTDSDIKLADALKIANGQWKIEFLKELLDFLPEHYKK